MKGLKRAAGLFAVVMALCSMPQDASARMTDDQVVSYVQSQIALGKSEQQIGKELLAKGVTKEQVERLRVKFNGGGQPAAAVAAVPVAPTTTREAIEDGTAVNTEMLAANTERGAANVFGHDIFTSPVLTFEPNVNQATPQNYRLGPGDEVVIDVWGASEDNIRKEISPEGSIQIDQIGPIYLNGLSIGEANNRIKAAFAKKYAGVEENETDVNVSLGQMRTIQVDIIGEVGAQGTYRLSPFSTVFHALYKAGGINKIGTMRKVQVMRNNRKIATIDIYDYLFKGKDTGNIRLQEGDVIIVPPYETLINITGNVKRPMKYEVKADETLADLIDFAGGFTGDAYSDVVRLSRLTGQENELYNIEAADFASYPLRDGDEVTVGTVVDRYTNRVQLRGPVMRPGTYAISDGLATLGQLINRAEGLLENAYTDRVLIYREAPDKTLQILPVDLGGVLAGTAPDIKLQRNDIIEIADVQAIFDKGDFTINGEVADPGSYPYAENTSIEDLILRAGGLRQGASTARIDVSRRIIDANATEPSNKIADIYTFTYKGGKVIGKSPDFELQPYDIVTVRKSPMYVAQQQVTIGGEVAFEGRYTIETRNERLSSLVSRAGGLNDAAYVRGAHLIRLMTEDEITARDEMLRLARMNQDGESGDSISIAKLQASNSYSVGIDLQKALENPGSSYDLVLRDGDVLFIPQLVNTVRVQGEVLFPNTVVYHDGMKYKYYIEQAGGFGERARKKNVYIVYMNGMVAKAKGSTPIEPGCQIIVPSKTPGKGVDWAAVMSIATAAGALGTMSASVANLLK